MATEKTYNTQANDLAIRYGQIRAVLNHVYDRPALKANLLAEISDIYAKLAAIFPTDYNEKIVDLEQDENEDDVAA